MNAKKILPSVILLFAFALFAFPVSAFIQPPQTTGGNPIFTTQYLNVGDFVGIPVNNASYDKIDIVGNNIFALGTYNVTSTGVQDLVIAKYNINGQFQWGDNIVDANNYNLIPVGLTNDTAGSSIYIGAYQQGQNTGAIVSLDTATGKVYSTLNVASRLDSLCGNGTVLYAGLGLPSVQNVAQEYAQNSSFTALRQSSLYTTNIYSQKYGVNASLCKVYNDTGMQYAVFAGYGTQNFTTFQAAATKVMAINLTDFSVINYGVVPSQQLSATTAIYNNVGSPAFNGLAVKTCYTNCGLANVPPNGQNSEVFTYSVNGTGANSVNYFFEQDLTGGAANAPVGVFGEPIYTGYSQCSNIGGVTYDNNGSFIIVQWCPKFQLPSSIANSTFGSTILTYVNGGGSAVAGYGISSNIIFDIATDAADNQYLVGTTQDWTQAVIQSTNAIFSQGNTPTNTTTGGYAASAGTCDQFTANESNGINYMGCAKCVLSGIDSAGNPSYSFIADSSKCPIGQGCNLVDNYGLTGFGYCVAGQSNAYQTCKTASCPSSAIYTLGIAHNYSLYCINGIQNIHYCAGGYQCNTANPSGECLPVSHIATNNTNNTYNINTTIGVNVNPAGQSIIGAFGSSYFYIIMPIELTEVAILYYTKSQFLPMILLISTSFIFGVMNLLPSWLGFLITVLGIEIIALKRDW